MELRVLKYFLTVAQEENISHAADILHVTQLTLSRQLADLEYELGVKLFHRGNRRITLTESGLLLRRWAEEVLTLIDKFGNVRFPHQFSDLKLFDCVRKLVLDIFISSLT